MERFGQPVTPVPHTSVPWPDRQSGHGTRRPARSSQQRLRSSGPLAGGAVGLPAPRRIQLSKNLPTPSGEIFSPQGSGIIHPSTEESSTIFEGFDDVGARRPIETRCAGFASCPTGSGGEATGSGARFAGTGRRFADTCGRLAGSSNRSAGSGGRLTAAGERSAAAGERSAGTGGRPAAAGRRVFAASRRPAPAGEPSAANSAPAFDGARSPRTLNGCISGGWRPPGAPRNRSAGRVRTPDDASSPSAGKADRVFDQRKLPGAPSGNSRDEVHPLKILSNGG